MQPDANKADGIQLTNTTQGGETATQVRQRGIAAAAKRKLHTDEAVALALRTLGCFSPGVHVIVDGQFGSTGKGLMAAVYAECGGGLIDIVTTNAGPNSGHTAYSPIDGQKIVTRQIPVASVILRLLGHSTACYLNAGAIIDPEVLAGEMVRWHFGHPYLSVHPNAAIIEEKDKTAEADPNGGPARIASTGKGVGSALARKIMREGNIAGLRFGFPCLQVLDMADTSERDVILIETAQGFSLGVNGQFYPHTTSRECTVAQALADARVPWRRTKQVIACYRTYPIRVGNTAVGQSGGCYSDQQELSWEGLGLEPELTTVTQRVRRVFSWSRTQFRESVAVNQPTVIFLNFAQYVDERSLGQLLDWISADYRAVMDRPASPLILLGYGPYNGDVRLL